MPSLNTVNLMNKIHKRLLPNIHRNLDKVNEIRTKRDTQAASNNNNEPPANAVAPSQAPAELTKSEPSSQDSSFTPDSTKTNPTTQPLPLPTPSIFEELQQDGPDFDDFDHDGGFEFDSIENDDHHFPGGNFGGGFGDHDSSEEFPFFQSDQPVTDTAYIQFDNINNNKDGHDLSASSTFWPFTYFTGYPRSYYVSTSRYPVHSRRRPGHYRKKGWWPAGSALN